MIAIPRWNVIRAVGFILVVMMLGIMVSNNTHAANLPSTITSGSYSSSDDTILSGGTTLDVGSMLSNAALGSLPAATFTAIRTDFIGSLTIALPTWGSSAWTANNIPLHALIQDGSGGLSLSIIAWITISGVLSLGSNITIAGGNFEFSRNSSIFRDLISSQALFWLLQGVPTRPCTPRVERHHT